MQEKTIGHIFAFFTVFVWGITFVVTKELLKYFSALDILVFRFLIAIIFLFLIYPKVFVFQGFKNECYMALAGIAGVGLYQFLENTALTYTVASNVSILTSIAPLYTSLLAFFILKERLNKFFFIGLVLSLIGVILITLNGAIVLKVNPVGDIICLLSTLLWAMYCITVKVLSKNSFNTIQMTRRIFCYGLLFMIPVALIKGINISDKNMLSLNNILFLLFLGVIASGICFYTWNKAVKIIGATLTALYIYLIPVVTIICAALFLKEKITWMAGVGTVIVLIGLFLSSNIHKKQEEGEKIYVK